MNKNCESVGGNQGLFNQFLYGDDSYYDDYYNRPYHRQIPFIFVIVFMIIFVIIAIIIVFTGTKESTPVKIKI